MSPSAVDSRRVTPEILIVGDPAGRRELADTIAASGYGVALCSPRELNRRVRTSTPPGAIVACMGDLDPDVLLAGLRRTRAGASIPVLLYGRLGGSLRDLADVLDIGADHFIEEPADPGELADALAQYAGPPERERVEARVRERTGVEDDYEGPASTERLSDPAGPRAGEPERRAEPRRRRGLGELHRTLDRVEARLSDDNGDSAPELAELGLERIPDVDPASGEVEDEPLVTEISEHLRGGPSGDSGAQLPARGDELTDPSPRPRRRSSRRGGRELDEDTGSGRDWERERGRGPSRDRDRGEVTDDGGQRTRSWDRPSSEGPLRPGHRRDPVRPLGRSGRPESRSAVLLGRRPGRDPHERDEPWPEDSSPGPRRRSARSSRRGAEPRESPWVDEDEGPRYGREPSESSYVGRRREGDEPGRDRGRRRGRDSGRELEPEPVDDPILELAREREREFEPEPRREPELRREPEPRREPERDRPRSRARGRRRPPPPAPSRPSLSIDANVRESGQLSAEEDVAALLWTLGEARFTGKLRLSRQRVEKQIWIHDGDPAFARSNATSDRLVDGLLRRGVLTRPQYETARRLAAKEPRRAGQLLVDAGFLKPRELDVLLCDHLARVIDATFPWVEGSWSTEPGERSDEAILLDTPMPALVLDGVRYRFEADELEARLAERAGTRSLVPKLRGTGDFDADERERAERIAELGERFRLLPEEESWLRRLDGRTGVAALIAEGADEQALFALLYTLELAGALDLRERPEDLAGEGEREPEGLDTERILERLRLAREADYFELLGVGRDAARSEIRQAHHDLAESFADEALEHESRRRHARELRELRAALDEARDILSDDAMRSAYLAHLGDPA